MSASQPTPAWRRGSRRSSPRTRSPHRPARQRRPAALRPALDAAALPPDVERALDEAYVAAIVDLVCRAERHFGRPQDVELARAGGRWFVLQSRPITTLD